MKLLIAILAVVGAFLLTIGVLPNGHDAEERMSNALLALIGIVVLVVDALVLIVWLIISRSA